MPKRSAARSPAKHSIATGTGVEAGFDLPAGRSGAPGRADANVAELNDWLALYHPFGNARLPEALAADFAEQEREPQRRIALVGVLVGILLYLVLFPFDQIIDPALLELDLLVRGGFGLPFHLLVLWLLSVPGRRAATYHIAATLCACDANASYSFVFAHSGTIAGITYLAVNMCTIPFAICLLGLPTRYAAAVCGVSVASMVASAALASDTSLAVSLSFATAGFFVSVPSLLASRWLQNERRRNFIVMRRDEHRLERITEQQAAMAKLAAIDPLTRIANRRGFDAELEAALERSTEHSLAVAMIDVDFFKRFNDTYGHLRGDEILQILAVAMVETCGPCALVGRMGGEEFGVAAVDMPTGEFVKLMQRLREAVERLGIHHESSEAASVVTISIGVASGRAKDLNGSSRLFQAADKALYSAKCTTRNRVCLAPIPLKNSAVDRKASR